MKGLEELNTYLESESKQETSTPDIGTTLTKLGDVIAALADISASLSTLVGQSETTPEPMVEESTTTTTEDTVE